MLLPVWSSGLHQLRMTHPSRYPSSAIQWNWFLVKACYRELKIAIVTRFRPVGPRASCLQDWLYNVRDWSKFGTDLSTLRTGYLNTRVEYFVGHY